MPTASRSPWPSNGHSAHQYPLEGLLPELRQPGQGLVIRLDARERRLLHTSLSEIEIDRLSSRWLDTGCTGQNPENPCWPTCPLFGPLPPGLSSVAMYLKRRTRHKDGKTHVYYSLCESLRVSRGRVVQRQVLQLGELNTTQVEAWQRTIEVLHEDAQRNQQRLFTDRDGPAPSAADAVQVRLSSLVVKQPRRFGDCWVGC